MIVGSLVTTDANRLGIGKIVSVGPGTAVLEYFESVARRSRVELPLGSLRRVRLSPQHRCYILRGESERWVAGRIGQQVDSAYEVLLPDHGALYLPERDIYVRCAGRSADPIDTLAAYGHETAFFHLHRSGFVRSLLNQRAASRGLTGLLSSRIRILPHQVEVVRRVLEDPVQRYLLADEVGLGKTIEAGAILRQFLLDDPRGRAVVLAPAFLVEQWQEELEEKFRISHFGNRVLLLPADALEQVEQDGRIGLLVIDEAHHLASLAGSDDSGQRGTFQRLSNLATRAERLLLLSATPALNHERDFMAMLHLLDPAVHRLDDVASFKRRVEQRQEIGHLLLPLTEGTSPFVLKRTAERLRAAFGDDAELEALTKTLLDSLSSPGAGAETRAGAVRAIREHVGETYRLHRRMLRSRRSTAASGTLGTRRDAGVFGQVVTEYDLDDEGADILGLLDEWRVAALAAISDVPEDVRNEARSRLAALYRVLLECAGTWLEMLAIAARARLSRQISPQCIADLGVAAARTLTTIPPFPGEMTILGAIAERASRAVGSGDRIALLEDLLAAAQRPGTRREKTVVFTSFPTVCKEVVRRLAKRLGSDSVAGHHADSGRDDVEAEVRRFRESGPCFVLVCDRSGEEGRNLQMAEWLVHFDLPLSPNRIEQRVGRLDRIGRDRAVRTRVLLGPDTEPSPYEAWYRLLRDGFGIFDGSIASLQFFVDERMPSLVEALFEGGPDALTAELVAAISADIASEQVRLDEQAVLDEIDTRAPGASSLDASIRELEAGWNTLREEMESWVCGALQFQPRRAGGATQYVPVRDRTLVPRDFLLGGFLPFAHKRGTFNREAAQGDVELYRAGHPLVELFARAIHADDRGQAFAIWRTQAGWPREHGAEWIGFRFDYAVQTDLAPAREILDRYGLAASAARSLLRRADAFFPPSLKVAFTDLSGKEVAESSLLQVLDRPFRRTRDGGTDTNLTKHRLATLERLVDRDAWAETCRAARAASERALRERPAFVEECGRLAAAASRELAGRVRALERRLRHGAADLAGAEREMAIERELAEALHRGIATPELRLDAVGCIVVSGRGPHEEEA